MCSGSEEAAEIEGEPGEPGEPREPGPKVDSRGGGAKSSRGDSAKRSRGAKYSDSAKRDDAW